MQEQVKIALAGGGEAHDSLHIDEAFSAWIGPQGKVLYWPIALRDQRSFQSCLEWFTDTFARFDINEIVMWTDLSVHTPSELEQFDAVYIGGGNTFSLLSQLRGSGFHNSLQAYVLGGKPVYGGSAGAVVLGRDIRTVSHVDPNTVGLTDTRGLDLADGHAIWVHYRPQDDRQIEAYVRKHHQPILAIPERSGIVINDARMYTVGFEPAFRFDEHGKTEV